MKNENQDTNSVAVTTSGSTAGTCSAVTHFAAAAAGAVLLTLVGPSSHGSDAKANGATAKKIKCYGVAKAGENDCGASDGSHGCHGKATADNLPTEWVYKPKNVCLEMGGKLSGPSK